MLLGSDSGVSLLTCVPVEEGCHSAGVRRGGTTGAAKGACVREGGVMYGEAVEVSGEMAGGFWDLEPV